MTKNIKNSFIIYDYNHSLVMKKKLLLVNPTYPRKVAGSPLQLLYLASALKDSDIETVLLDLNIKQDPEIELDNLLKNFKPTHVGVTSYSPNYPESLSVFDAVKRYDSRIITISGGPHEIATNGQGKNFDGIDYVVTDTFGENVLRRLLGVKEKLNRTALFPAYELLEDNINYQFGNKFLEGRKIAQILTATGCDQKCSFCSAQQRYSPFSEDIVISQLKEILDRGYEAVFFNDPNFTNPFDVKEQGKYGRTISLNKRLVTEGINQRLKYGIQTKATLVTPDLLDVMRKGGLGYVCYALENIDQKSLKDMRKGVTPKRVSQAINWSKERGIDTGLYVMFGTKVNEREDLQVLEQTLDYIEEIRPDWLSISVLAYYPMKDRMTGFPLHQELDYANERFSRESVWLNFDEGWGAFHPNCDSARAQKYLQAIQQREVNNPEIWANIKRF